MRFSIIFFFIVALVLSGCSNPVSGDSTETSGNGTIRVINNTSSAIDFVHWESSDGTVYYFSSDEVFDTSLNRTVDGMNSGSNCIETVKLGHSALYFFLATGGTELGTSAVYTVGDGDSVVITLTDDTTVTAATEKNQNSIPAFDLSTLAVKMKNKKRGYIQ